MKSETRLDRTQKEDLVSFLKGVFATSASIVVGRNLGLNGSEMSDLRNQMREEGATLKVIGGKGQAQVDSITNSGDMTLGMLVLLI